MQSQTRHDMMQRYVQVTHTLLPEVQRLEQGWKGLADQYGRLPRALRRDLTLDHPKERFYCAALFQHINSFPNTITVKAVYHDKSVQEVVDIGFGETCPRSGLWYKFLLDAREMMRDFENKDSTFIDIPKLQELVVRARIAYDKAVELLRIISLPLDANASPPAEPTLAKMHCWGLLCHHVADGNPLEEEISAYRKDLPHQIGPIPGPPPGIPQDQTAPVPTSGPAVRYYVPCEVPLPSELEQTGRMA